MELNELRIGNYVNVEFCRLCNDDFYWQQHQINPLDFENILMYPDKYKPFPLTKEWLVRLGFEKIEQYIKRGNGADWQPEYPRTIFDSYIVKDKINDNVFAYVFENMQWADKNRELEESKSTRIIYGDFYESVDGSNSVYCKEIKYVHQLQNLFFALTGEELTIKE